MPWILHEDTYDESEVLWFGPKDVRDDERTRILDGIHNPRFSGDPSMLPLKFRQNSDHTEFHAFMRGGMLGVILVNREFRDLLEEWDPGQSYYYPAVLHCKDGRILENEYYLHKFKTFIDDGIIVEKSDVEPVVRHGEIRRYSSTARPKLVWRREKIKNRHVFADRFLASRFSVSDALMAAIEARNLSGFSKTESFEE